MVDVVRVPSTTQQDCMLVQSSQIDEEKRQRLFHAALQSYHISRCLMYYTIYRRLVQRLKARKIVSAGLLKILGCKVEPDGRIVTRARSSSESYVNTRERGRDVAGSPIIERQEMNLPAQPNFETGSNLVRLQVWDTLFDQSLSNTNGALLEETISTDIKAEPNCSPFCTENVGDPVYDLIKVEKVLAQFAWLSSSDTVEQLKREGAVPVLKQRYSAILQQTETDARKAEELLFQEILFLVILSRGAN